MNWQELTGDEFPEAAAKAGGVCLVPLGCLERHGHHLPLGTDVFIAHELCQRAAALEPALVFPDVFFTQILEARHYPGAIALPVALCLHLLEEMCAEIARNGLAKIVLVNAHGGNSHLLRLFAQGQLHSRRDYVVYVLEAPLLPEEAASIEAQWETGVDGHAGESETSQVMAIRPDLVKMEQAPDGPEGLPLERLRTLSELGVYTGIWWYADHPTHYRGDGRPASAEKGERELAARARALAAVIRLVKADNESRRLQDEFFERVTPETY